MIEALPIRLTAFIRLADEVRTLGHAARKVGRGELADNCIAVADGMQRWLQEVVQGAANG